MTANATATDELRTLISRGELVKICGLRELEHAAAAARAGADLIGFIFAPARRQVTASVARSCIAAAREAAAGRTLLAVGVFVDALPAEIAGIAEHADLDAVQLNGAEPPEFIQSIRVPAIKAVRPRPQSRSAEVVSVINCYRSAATPPVGVLVDGYSDQAAGGTGVRADWTVAAGISARTPVLLAGGLDPENVGAAIRLIRPQGVDVSSGVEVDGVKDSALIARFISEARAAFQDETGLVRGSRVPSPR